MDRKSKQVIVIRKDLNMRKGKMVAQGAHASMKPILDAMSIYPDENPEHERSLCMKRDSAMYDWITGLFTKVCVSVNSESELLALYEKAKSAGIPCALITDAGLTEFNGVPTNTCIAVGPAWSDEVDSITAGLPLL